MNSITRKLSLKRKKIIKNRLLRFRLLLHFIIIFIFILQLTTGKSQQNGVVNTGAVKVSDKKTLQKKVTVIETKSSSVSEDKAVNNKIVKKDKIKSRSSAEQRLEAQDIEDKDSGEWVQLISKKERKNRKQKEEQLLNELQETNVKTKSLTSPKKQKKGKENKDKNDKSVKLDSNANIDETKVADNKKVRKEANVENDKINVKQEKTVKDEELIAEDPDIYELVKEQRIPKKTQKHRLNKRNSDSEITPKLESISENETNVNQTDKLTASIVANYEANDQNKPDSLSMANNKKKKDKNKKKQSQTSANNATNDKQVINKDNKNAFTPVIETAIEKSENAINTAITNGISIELCFLIDFLISICHSNRDKALRRR